MELEVTLPPYMGTVNLIRNILRLEQFDFFQYGAKRYPVRSQPILTHATHNFSPKNRRDRDFHKRLLSRNFNCDLCKCRNVLPPRFLVSVTERERAIWVMERRAFPGGGGTRPIFVYRWVAGGLRPWPCLGQKKNPEIHTLFRTLIVHGFCSGFSSLNLLYS